ncbi:hypothetical protein QUF80_09255 [Desulfococcaceae bacterium HSG8]|nr:hypothetical protein [Desulfococcaceae bacterium HSG8]
MIHPDLSESSGGICKVISGKKYTRGQFVVPPSGGVTPPEGGTADLNLVYSSLLEIA